MSQIGPKVNAYLNRRVEMCRMSVHGDDREHPQKWLADAELRGQIGRDKANEIIAGVDRVRSYR